MRFRKLGALMLENDETQRDIARLLKVSREYVSHRFNCQGSWTLDEMYAIMEHYHVAPDQMHIIFPKNGLTI